MEQYHNLSQKLSSEGGVSQGCAVCSLGDDEADGGGGLDGKECNKFSF